MVRGKRSERVFAVGEAYHVYNRGVEKRTVVEDSHDSDRFVKSLIAFNTTEPIGSIYQHSFKHNITPLSTPSTKSSSPLVDIIAFCLNPNHYHMLVIPLVENGLSLFMQKFGGGYTRYYNEMHKRAGVLFQGRFKVRHITDDGDLQRMSAYVNLNNKIHQLSTPSTKLVRSSWLQYSEGKKGICSTGIITDGFKSSEGYKKFAEQTVREIIRDRARSTDDSYKKELYATYFE